MRPTTPLRLLLALGSLIALGIGTSILVAPAWFHASHGIELGSDANLLSEVRAPGGALLVLGFLMLIGVFVRAFTLASTSVAAAVYLAYGLSRLLSIALDGVPDTGLVVAAVVELAVGGACAVALSRSAKLEGLEVPDELARPLHPDVRPVLLGQRLDDTSHAASEVERQTVGRLRRPEVAGRGSRCGPRLFSQPVSSSVISSSY